jgi:uncharacterized protein (DUF362 family)/Pyruvate/2-oxoacid:ferredoxin oxidoreductase delta subunit
MMPPLAFVNCFSLIVVNERSFLSTVSLVRCETYESGALETAIRKALDLIGGIKRFVTPGARVLLKPNLLCARSPEKCVTTHPAVVRVVAKMVLDVGGKPFIGDSPAIEPFKWVAAKSGMDKVSGDLGIELIELTNPTLVFPPPGTTFRKLAIASEALKADVVINLPKLKTHCQMLFTLGVKNLFGTIVSQRKAEWHCMVGMDRDTFASLLLDIYSMVKPAVTILDGVWGMEGHGPSNGRPKKINLVAAAMDAVALDISICNLLGGSLHLFPIFREARSRKIGETEIRRIMFKGDDPQSFVIHDFQIPVLDSLAVLPGAFHWFAKNYLVSKPFHEEKFCADCGQCEKICPAGAITIKNKKCMFDYNKCIRCYCCQEICPHDAIRFKKGLLVRLLTRFNR